MAGTEDVQLSRRERQLMDIVYARGDATVSQVLADLPDPPTRTAVRTLLRILEEKGHLTHSKAKREFVYHPVKPRNRAGRSALQRLLRTFFDGSIEKAVAAHFADPDTDLSQVELKRLTKLVKDARQKESRNV